MDAPTIRLALAAVCAYSATAAIEEEMRQRELERMARHDIESHVAQAHFTYNLQVTPRRRPQTWYSMFLGAWTLLLEVQQLVLVALIRLQQSQIDRVRLLLIEMDRRAGSVWAPNEQYGEDDADGESDLEFVFFDAEDDFDGEDDAAAEDEEYSGDDAV